MNFSLESTVNLPWYHHPHPHLPICSDLSIWELAWQCRDSLLGVHIKIKKFQNVLKISNICELCCCREDFDIFQLTPIFLHCLSINLFTFIPIIEPTTGKFLEFQFSAHTNEMKLAWKNVAISVRCPASVLQVDLQEVNKPSEITVGRS